MGSLSPHEACVRLADDLEHHWSSDEVLNRSHKDLIVSLRCACKDASDEISQIWALMPAFAYHIWEVLKDGRPAEFKLALLSTLADTTREVPFWRPLFGLAARPDYTANMKQRQWMNAPDSILEVARRIIAGTIRVQSSPPMRSALRIIGNCCADNNVNRSIMINRDGIEDLLEEVLRKRQECDLVIPVLYNVCIDYDEPALGPGPSPRPWPPIPETQAFGDKDYSGTTFNAAEQRLGYYYFLYEDKTTYDILLDAWDQAQGCAGTIADLIEMGSRVALFGADMFLQQNDGRDPWDIGFVDTTPAIVRLLLTKGIELAQVDTDCRISICQALLNLLSQTEIQAIVINTEGLLWSLIHLPYPRDYNDLPDDEQQSLQVYQKAFLKLVYHVSALDAYAQQMTVQLERLPRKEVTDRTSLIAKCILSLRPHDRDIPLPHLPPRLLASIYVLIGNGVTTEENALSLIRSTTILLHFCTRFASISDPQILLPAIGVATRLAMCQAGQGYLQRILPDVVKLLLTTASEVDATGTEIHRNACLLTRLLIKGNTGSLSLLIKQLAASPKLFNPHDPVPPHPIHAALSLFSQTKDAQTKLEIGRLSIEVLRLLATLRTQERTTLPGTPGEIFNDAFEKPTPASSASVADTIAYILTQSQAQSQSQSSSPSQPAPPDLQLEGEGWFGLGLLSTYPSTHVSIRTALARDEYKVLNRLGEIVTQNSSPSMPVPTTTFAEPGTTDLAADTSHEPLSSEPLEHSKDPRYENIKVLVVRMIQSPSAMEARLELLRLNGSEIPVSDAAVVEADRGVQEGLEAAAAEMGLDWVLV